ncbi:hypothetical protein BB560_006826 [Smittium megazygosporum]|uniref:O-acyltransferase n=1 Tax=Smittium megazygosporum TaxID=133381 RepID=A0A2T9Y131_9FUNG|nr:hypothetical protein BB560_006826 [Smittium megazygosporum]
MTVRTHSSQDSIDLALKSKVPKRVLKIKPYPQAQVTHSSEHISLLDKEAPPIRFNGLANFSMLLLGGMMIRLILENYLKYGLLIKLPGFEIQRVDWLTLVTCTFNLITNFLVSYAIEKYAAKSAIAFVKKGASFKQNELLAVDISTNKWILLSQMFLVFYNIFLPSVLVYKYMRHPLVGSLVMTFSVILSLKIFSYAMTNLDLRRAYMNGDEKLEDDILSQTKLSDMKIVLNDTKIKTSNIHPIKYDVSYPDNITLSSYMYFWAAPTFCYQPSYPRNKGPIRWGFVARRLFEILFCGTLMYCVCQQYAYPTLVNSVKAVETKNQAWISERVLKLSVVVSMLWLIGFYALFHSILNINAELLGFSDRNFYLSWWNSSDLGSYWREWNLPIHNFCKRHIMSPLTSPPLSLSIDLGVFFTFFISAVLHELIFGIPTRSLKGYSFFGMILQIPLINLTSYVTKIRGPDSNIGNTLFWISFCIIGQPFLVLQYFYDWVEYGNAINT